MTGTRSDLADLADVPVALALLAAVDLAVLLEAPQPIRLVATAVALFVLPGYALTTFAFPVSIESREREVGITPSLRSSAEPGIPWVERAALSLGLSVALVPLFGLLLGALGREFLPRNVLAVVTAFVALALVGGAVRRYSRPAEDRYAAPSPFARLVGAMDAEPVDAVLNVAVPLAALAAAGSVLFALATPAPAATYTTAALLTEQPDGELATANYTSAMTGDDPGELVLELTNHERRTVRYTVLVQRQRVDTSTETVRNRTRLHRFERTLDDGASWRRPHALRRSPEDGRYRVVYLIYRGDPPADPTTDNAYRHLTLWLNRTDGTARAPRFAAGAAGGAR
jgi:uncharacterized membrane protein